MILRTRDVAGQLNRWGSHKSAEGLLVTARQQAQEQRPFPTQISLWTRLHRRDSPTMLSLGSRSSKTL